MTQPRNLHEQFERDELVTKNSERSFGFVFAAVFLLIGLWPLHSGGAPRGWALAMAGLFLLAALGLPRVLRPLNAVWLGIGLVLHRLVSPFILGLLFYLTVTPTGLIMRALGKDPLRLRFDRQAKSYWIERRPPGPAPDSLRNQF